MNIKSRRITPATGSFNRYIGDKRLRFNRR